MVRTASSVADRLQRRALELGAYVARIDQLARSGELGTRDVDRSYSGAFISFYGNLEEALGDLFVGVLHGRLRLRQGRARALVRFRSEEIARKVVRGDRAYLDWLPYGDRVKPRAAVYFADGDVFRTVQATRIRPLTSATIIRNALAHESEEALARFRRELIDGRPIPPAEWRPASYLRGTHGAGVTRFGNLLAECVQTLHLLAM